MLSKLAISCLSKVNLQSRISTLLATPKILIEKNQLLYYQKTHYSTNQRPFKISGGGNGDRNANKDSMYYIISIGVVFLGLSFAAIPAYRIFCEATAFGGTTQVADDLEKIEKMEKVKDRLIKVQFNADVPSSMQWHFKPLQDEIYVHPGETALAFYTGSL